MNVLVLRKQAVQFELWRSADQIDDLLKVVRI
jgi:hypothetical protein